VSTIIVNNSHPHTTALSQIWVNCSNLWLISFAVGQLLFFPVDLLVRVKQVLPRENIVRPQSETRKQKR